MRPCNKQAASRIRNPNFDFGAYGHTHMERSHAGICTYEIPASHRVDALQDGTCPARLALGLHETRRTWLVSLEHRRRSVSLLTRWTGMAWSSPPETVDKAQQRKVRCGLPECLFWLRGRDFATTAVPR